ncbi:hypothetical protein [Corynebacterium sp. HS2168-gen11]|uniref:hypothetical protein n=1 Tax=Corynebacterium sp. HS2168-gen11 TaxID=2974027 RepID=UPI00216AB5A6|nr:hypothetical protein [Corynebacterium sp. HS2168-gen11]MCS4535188.1 hypothetical protein [Corynebacterium sp. HS2168-gen11]
MKRTLRTSVAAIAAAATLATMTAAPAFAQETTSETNSDGTFFDGLTSLSTDEVGIITPERIRDFLKLIETVIRTMNSLVTFANTASNLGR